MRFLFEVAKEFKCLLTFFAITGFALIFWHIGAKEIATGFGGGALALITSRESSHNNQANKPPK